MIYFIVYPDYGGNRVIRRFIQRFMMGRYGPDHLSVAMIVFSLVLSLFHAVFRFPPILYASYIILALVFLRLISRNITRRRAENDRFIRYYWPLRTKVRRTYANIKHRKTFRFFLCPSCDNTLRVPKGKGKLQITCPKCGERFFRKT